MSRSLNFSDRELDVILTYLETNKELVTKEFGGSLKSAADHRKAWDVLTELVNSVGFGNRKTDSIKQKWCDLKYKTKKRASGIQNYVNKTGGGPQCDSLSSIEERILNLIGPTCVHGITSEIFDTSYNKETGNTAQPDLFIDNVTPARSESLDVEPTILTEQTTPSSWHLSQNGSAKSSRTGKHRKRRYAEMNNEIEEVIDTQAKISSTLQDIKMLLENQTKLMEETLEVNKKILEAQNVQTAILAKIGNVQLEYTE